MPSHFEQTRNLVNLDAFYSADEISTWKQVIGNDLHYHFGDFSQNEAPADALRRTVRNFYDVIPAGCRVLDAGCGWGGPARLLSSEHGCDVTGVTVSATQARYCLELGLNAWHLDLEKGTPDGSYDTVLFLESFEHVQKKSQLLSRLRGRCRQVIISSNAWADGNAIVRPTFGSSSACSTPSELCAILLHNGFRPLSMHDRRPQSLPTLHFWKRNFAALSFTQFGDTQLDVLKDFTDRITESPENLAQFAENAPLVDILAIAD